MLKQVKVDILNIAKKHHFILSIIRNIKFFIGRLKYLFFYTFSKTDNKMIIFESYMGKSFSCSPKAIYLELLKDKRYKNYKFIWAFKEPNKYKFLQDKRNTIVVKYASRQYYEYYSKAKYWVTNSRLSELIKKRKNQIYIQCWHGTPLKKLGYDISVPGGNAMNSIKDIRKKYKNDSKRYSYMISPSKFCTEKFISAFNLQYKNIVKEIGYPRNDYLINYDKNDINKIKKKLKIPLNKKVILYAPTWRDNMHKSGVGYTYKLNIDFNEFQKKYSDKYIILFKSHYFIANYIDLKKYKGFVYNVSDYDDINELYIISDLLITDYSSVFFDYANLKKPILFYMYDLDEYKTKLRDFYINLDELPGPIIKTQDQLEKEIDNISNYKKEYSKKYRLFNKKYNYLSDGKSSERFIEQIIFKNRKRIVPLIINIFKNIKMKDKKIIISGFCLTKILRLKKTKLKDLKILLNNKIYNIKFLFKKGMPFLKNYRFNFYRFTIPIDDLLNADIQNKIVVLYKEKYKGRIIYNIFDLLKGENRNSKIVIYNEKSIYLRQTIKNSMYITVRDSNYFDFAKGKMKLVLGYVISKIYLKKNIILLFEKECSKYEESASVLYERLIDEKYKNVYFILNKDNVKLKLIEDKYKKNIIYKNSLIHIIYFFKCKKFIGTESIGHSMQLRIASRLVINKEKRKNISYVFLQHGVMYMISLNSELRTGFRKQCYKLHKIVVSSLKEAYHFIKLGDFEMKDLYVCGLPKFDVAYRKKDSKKIVIMPTWRRWEVNQAASDFEKTKYFKMIKRILNGIPKRFQKEVIILPHPLMINAIKKNNKYQKYLPKGEFIYDDILKECSVLITDYSSISYDAFFRGSNIIFYWQEKEECLKKYGKGTKLMLNEKNAFGDICYNQKDLKRVFKDNYMTKQKNKYKLRYKSIVQFSDRKNTDRLVQMLKKDKII